MSENQAIPEGEKKEDFCIGCAAGLLGVGIGSGTAMQTRKDRKKKKAIFIGAIILTIISILILIYALVKNCKDCK